MSDLEVQALVKRYEKNLVVDKVSFKVKSGEFFVLLGPSGGGKTTILRIICGLETADEGRIILGDRDITRLAPRQRNLGMVFQDYGLYPNMDVFGNIAYGLEARNVPRAEIERRVPKAAEMLGLQPLLKRRITELSGGEQQRVALARALVKDADAFLYDEPLANLDPKLRYQARRDILQLHRARRKPSVYVTHDQSEAFAVADRIAVIAKGHLQQVGTPDDLIEAPANIFMARFVGSPPMNLLSGKLISRAGRYAVESHGLIFELPDTWKETLTQYSGPDIVVGIRPSTIIPEWQAQQLELTVPSLTAEVVDLEVLVGEMIATLRLQQDVTITAIFPEKEGDLPKIGERIKISIDPATLRLFNPASEQALKVERI